MCRARAAAVVLRESGMDKIDLVAMLLAGPRPPAPPPPVYALPPEGPYDCQACGACCVEAGVVAVYETDTGVPDDLRVPFLRQPGIAVPPSAQKMATHVGGRCKALTG